MDLKAQFRNCFVLGDSIAEGLLDYDVLSTENVYGIRGRRIDNNDEELAEAVSKKPSHIFLEYGMNDLTFCKGNAEAFVENYKEKIDYIKQKDKDIKIYVISILPIEDYAIASVPVYANYNLFNDALEKMCEEEKINYIDTTFIMNNPEYEFEGDGIHPKYAYYPYWAEYMAKVAGL